MSQKDRPKYLPTPQQIARETAKIRAGWDEQTRLERSVGIIRRGRGNNWYQREPWRAPEYVLHTNRDGSVVAERIA